MPTPENYQYDFPDLISDAVDIWDQNAEWWDDKVGDGNDFLRLLIEPSTHELLDIQPGERVLDIACGAGRLARQLVDQGARVTAIDHSKKFINRARKRSADYGDELEFKVINTADMDALLALGEQSFDAAVISMAIMDMAVISTPIAALARLLKPDGRAVFSITHPAFNSSDIKPHGERGEIGIDGRASHEHRVSISRYTTSYQYKGEGIMGQPEPQWYFHRSVSTLISAWANEGFVVDAMSEPSLPASESTNPNAISWGNLPDIPPILVMRLRLG